jgi:hypothetical protein
MSSHFNYEIDEHRIRIQLKEHQVFFNEEAWNNYEKYVEKFRVRELENSKKIKFGINRNIILPIVFFGIIVFFTFILYKFLSIKNNIPLKNYGASISQDNKAQPMPQKKVLVPIKKNVLDNKDSLSILNKPITDSIPNKNTSIKNLDNFDLLLDEKNEFLRKKNNVKKTSRSITPKKNKIEILNPLNIPSLLPLQSNENTEPELK